MKLAPREKDKLHNIYILAELARRRRARGTKLNYEEATALIAEATLEGARDGKSVAELMSSGRQVVNAGDCMEGVADLLHVVMIECTFPDGTKLVSVHDPIGPASEEPRDRDENIGASDMGGGAAAPLAPPEPEA